MFQQSVVNKFNPLGFSGEFYSNQPQRTRSAILASAQNKKSYAGLVATYNKDSGVAGVGQDGAVAGIIGSPKTTFRQTINSSLELNDGQQIELIQQGYVIVECVWRANASAKKGDFAYYNPETGEITTFTPTQTPTAGYKRLPGSTVEIQHVDLNGKADGEKYMAVIYVDLAGDRTETK